MFILLLTSFIIVKIILILLLTTINGGTFNEENKIFSQNTIINFAIVKDV